ncbi:integrase catalytic domain-containing protein [Trichonephila clavipes]|nr:integrase catalytic domain-containing protein [Trichonephila clavipes]
MLHEFRLINVRSENNEKISFVYRAKSFRSHWNVGAVYIALKITIAVNMENENSMGSGTTSEYLKSLSSGPSPLPPDRVTDCAIFEVVGIDLAGPLFLKTGEKVWITLFTCAVYRALHLELVNALSSDAFLLALRRFIARRGRPMIIYCDNGTNFRGAFNDLAKLDRHKISRETSTQKIVWKFIPPTAAWWEAGGKGWFALSRNY